ncbi:MAG: FAD-dependent oxidoreductase [Desulfomonilaceae bacterium]
MRAKKKIAIIGAGPAGLAAAYQLSKHDDFDINLYESAAQVGGMCKTVRIMGQRVDLGPHRFFSSDSRVNNLWLEAMGDNYLMIDRVTRIFYRNRFFHYPLKPLNALTNLGFIEAMLCIMSHFRHRLFPISDESNFENWVINRFGSRLFNIFFRGYTEKLWGINCENLDASFAAQRIKGLSLFAAIKNAFVGTSDTDPKTLVDQFAYPRNGTGEVYTRMVKEFVRRGGKLFLNKPVYSLTLKDGNVRGLILESGDKIDCDAVISSMPLTRLVSRIPDLPNEVLLACQQLRYRNTLIVYLKVDSNHVFPDQWIYVHSPELKVGRISNFRNWSPHLFGNEQGSVLAMEYWCHESDDLWLMRDDQLIELGKEEIRATSLINSSRVIDAAVYRIEQSYPVYSKGYHYHLNIIQDFLKQIPNLSMIGRYGAFKYNNQDHSILMGILVAENIAHGASNNLWEVNTDYNYQEASRISETGLVSLKS